MQIKPLTLLALSAGVTTAGLAAAQSPRVPASPAVPGSAAPAQIGAAAKPTAPMPTPLLSLLPDNGLVPTGSGSGRFDAGEINPVQTPRLERVVTLKNETAHPIVIGQLRGSCGCTTILMAKDGRETRQASLLPGEQAQLRVAIRTAGLHTGAMSKFVWAYTPGNTKPSATIEIAFSIQASVIFTPSLLNFGKISSGLAASSPLTVSVQASLAPSGALPPLVSSNSDVSVVEEGAAQTLRRSGKAWIERRYRVMVRAQARSGALSGAIHFANPAASAPPSPPQSAAASTGATGTAQPAASAAVSPLAALSVPITGEVSGGLTLMPRTVYLGSLVSGREVKRQVVLSGGSPKTLQNMTFTTSSPYVTASLLPEGGRPSSSTTVQIVEITLNGQAPAGAMQAQVTITTATGEKLLLPVIAVIMPAR